MKVLWMIMLFLLFALNGNSQVPCDSILLVNCINTTDAPSFVNLQYPYNKAFYYAMSYFPGFNTCRIVFRERKIRTTMNVRPSIGSLIFNSKNNRKYIIRVNNTKRDSMVYFADVPLFAQIGLFGHELSHIKDYKLRSNFNILLLGFSYMNIKKREKYEKAIDTLTIQQGLGCYLLEWAKYIQFDSNASAKYKKVKRDVYLEPHEIEGLIGGEAVN